MKQRVLLQILAATLLLGSGVAVAASRPSAAAPSSDSELARRVAHAVAMYPYYTIWDEVNVSASNGRVKLSGEVSMPFKKSDLEQIVKQVPGVDGVDGGLKVLPLSTYDDRLRLQIARAIYSDPALLRYADLAYPPIHIIVENGHVTLSGVVNSQLEKTVAGMRASGTGLGFGPVVNNLVVENTPAHGG